MKIGIMQPYFFPYIGYWQLMNYVDEYIVFDDVNYINKGWIDRNRILINGIVSYINLPVLGKSQNKMIDDILVNNDEKLKYKLIKKIELSYKKSPYFVNVFPMIEEIITNKEDNLALYLTYSLKLIAKYLDIRTKITLSSDLKNDKCLKSQEKILDICRLLNATEYVNAIGGKELYSKDKFDENKIKLKFLRTNEIIYKQASKKFEPNLSIIDVLMNCPKEQVKEFLKMFELE